MKKYRLIEVNAFRRRVTTVSSVSGDWRRDITEAQPARGGERVSLNDRDLGEPVAPDSPEGQLLLVEAVRSLERSLLPEARASIRNLSKDFHSESEGLNPDKEKGL